MPAIEAWIDFRWGNESLEAHIDVGVWRFFYKGEIEKSRAEEEKLNRQLRQMAGWRGWVFVIKGSFSANHITELR